ALQDSGNRLAPAREWRGKQVIHPDLHHARLAALSADGYAFVVAEADGPVELSDAPGPDGWPVLAVTPKGHLTFFSPEHETQVAAGDRVVSFRAVAAPEARPRRRGWRADGPATPRAALAG
ncbi:MAG: hypothetical protein INR64_11110, partial [Caulobacteraceae bacterium]|nr:hypothetical protein [Caulobacter sp.]